MMTRIFGSQMRVGNELCCSRTPLPKTENGGACVSHLCRAGVDGGHPLDRLRFNCVVLAFYFWGTREQKRDGLLA